MMECCGNIVSGGRRAALLHFGKKLVSPFRPIVQFGMHEKSGFWSLFNSAGRRPRFAAVLLSRSCISAKGDDGLRIGKSNRSAESRFPILPESCLNQTTRRDFLIVAMAEEEGNHGTEEETCEDEVANLGPPVTVRKSALLTSPDFWLQVGIFVFTAGFVDAGFSGDWSRIGVISKDIEGDLQMAAVGVVPLAATLIWSISERRKRL